MHICGTHEDSISKWGIRSLLPDNIRVIAGPGCPVCVCPAEDVGQAIEHAKKGRTIITFGDMLKVPSASLDSLDTVRAAGADIRMVYSARDAVNMAEGEPEKEFIWFGVGFETTIPMTAFEIIKGLPSNLKVLPSYRIVPPAMTLLCEDPDFPLDGFICPGHVSVIIGTTPYEPYAAKYRTPCAIAGFEPVDVMLGVKSILAQLSNDEPIVDNVYTRVVRSEGNPAALAAIKKAFKLVDAKWRGIGVIPQSGYDLADEFAHVRAETISLPPVSQDFYKGCLCGAVILGKAHPTDCPHFMRRCTTDTPLGPCMVSDEGTCSIVAKFGDRKTIHL